MKRFEGAAMLSSQDRYPESTGTTMLENGLTAARDALLSTQNEDGHWCFPLEADCTIPAEYVLMMHFMDDVDVDLEVPLFLGWRGKQFLDMYLTRVNRTGFQAAQYRKGYHDSARPVRDLTDVKWKPPRQQDDLHRHKWNGAPRNLPIHCKHYAGKHVRSCGPAVLKNGVPRARHVRRLGRVPDNLESVICLYSTTQIECTPII